MWYETEYFMFSSGFGSCCSSLSGYRIGALESVMCDVIKISLKGGMRGELGMETPEKEMDNRRISMTSHMTISTYPHNNIL